MSGEQRFWLETSTYKQLIVMITELRSWLEASTLSNHGEMRQHLPTDKNQVLTAGWKPVPDSAMICFGTGFQPAVFAYITIRRLRPRLLKV